MGVNSISRPLWADVVHDSIVIWAHHLAMHGPKCEMYDFTYTFPKNKYHLSMLRISCCPKVFLHYLFLSYLPHYVQDGICILPFNTNPHQYSMYFYTPDLSGRIRVWRGRLSVCLSVRLSTKLVNKIQTEPFKLEPSNLVHLLLMTRGRTLLIFKVRGQRSRSHVTH